MAATTLAASVVRQNRRLSMNFPLIELTITSLANHSRSDICMRAAFSLAHVLIAAKRLNKSGTLLPRLRYHSRLL
jgi:hypothetical protein